MLDPTGREDEPGCIDLGEENEIGKSNSGELISGSDGEHFIFKSLLRGTCKLELSTGFILHGERLSSASDG